MTFRRYTALALSLMLLLAPLTALAAPKEPLPAPPPPMPQAQSVSIFRGHHVDIPLRAIGRASSPLDFLIRSKPSCGKLGPIRRTGRKSAVVTYAHDAAMPAGEVTFTYAVQGVDTAVSAPARVTITVSEEPPELSVVRSLDFGGLMLGETREKEFLMRNTGGGLLTGKVSVPPPWKVLGSAKYQLTRKTEKKFRLIFAPQNEGVFNGKVTFSHDGRASVSLSGAAVSPFEFRPAQGIELKATGTDTMRSGSLLIRNKTPQERTLQIAVPPEIAAPEKITIPAGSQTSLTLRTSDGFRDTLEGTMTIQSEGFRCTVPLMVFARPARLSVEPRKGIDFGDVRSGRHYEAELRITNEGGVNAPLKVIAPEEILLRPNPRSLVLAPGEERHFKVVLEAHFTGTYQSQLTIGVDDDTNKTALIHIPIAAEFPKAAPSHAPSPSPMAAKVPTALLAPVPKQASPQTLNEEVDFSSIPAVTNIQIAKVVGRDLEITWKKPTPDVTSYIVEQRLIEPVKHEPPKITWHPLRGIKFREENGAAIARFENLPPGRTWFLRVSSLDGDGKRSAPSATFRIATPLPKKTLFYWVLGGVILAGGGVLVYRMIRQRRLTAEAGHAARIAKLDQK